MIDRLIIRQEMTENRHENIENFVLKISSMFKKNFFRNRRSFAVLKVERGAFRNLTKNQVTDMRISKNSTCKMF